MKKNEKTETVAGAIKKGSFGTLEGSFDQFELILYNTGQHI
jgi:hypothetical protein